MGMCKFISDYKCSCEMSFYSRGKWGPAYYESVVLSRIKQKIKRVAVDVEATVCQCGNVLKTLDDCGLRDVGFWEICSPKE
jgi:hypothetical protein